MAGMTDDDLFNAAPLPVSAPAPVAQVTTPAPQTAPAAGNSGMAVNNPLNLKPFAGGSWPGEGKPSPAGFATFADPASGWNAADANLQAKVTKHGLTTIAGIIGDPTNGWAPASDNNDPVSYAAKVAGALDVKPTDDISQRLLTDPTFRHNMLEQMAGVETGAPQKFGGGAGILTADEQAQWDALAGPKAGTYPTGTPAPDLESDAMKVLTLASVRDEGQPRGSIYNPEGQEPGKGAPTDPNTWYVTPNGELRLSGNSTSDFLPQLRQNLKNANNPAAAVSGFLQGIGPDVVASAGRLTGGGLAVDNPLYAAFGQGIGGPSAYDLANAAKEGMGAQQQQYALQNVGNNWAKTGRVVGQAVPAAMAAAAVPEVEAPSALSGLAPKVAGVATNALRGLAATAPSVGASKLPVAQQLAVGTAGGAVLPPLLDKAGDALASMVGQKTVSPGMAQLADTAVNKYGIPVRVGQISANSDDRYADDVLLGSNPTYQANNAQQRQAYMRGVTNSYGDPSGSVGSDALNAAHDRIGGVLNDVTARNRIDAPTADAVQTKVGQIIGRAQEVLGNDAKPLLNMAEKIGSVRDQNGISGPAFQSLTKRNSSLDRLTNNDNSDIAYFAGQMKDALGDGMAANMSPADQQAFQNARWQYKNLMTVEKLAPKADANGEISPPLLRGAVMSNFKNMARQGAGDLGELAQIGQSILKPPPQTGSANRAKALMGPIGIGATGMGEGAAAALALMHDPNALPVAAGTLAGSAALAGVKGLSRAVQASRLGPSGTSALVTRSLPGAPGSVIGNALSGLGGVAKPVEVPLSALAGVRGLQLFPNSAGPVAANAQ